MVMFEGSTFSLYVNREPYSYQWFHDVLHTLWKHGMRFGVYPEDRLNELSHTLELEYLEVGSWEEELRRFIKQSLSSKQEPKLVSVAQAIEQLTSGALKWLTCWDKRVEMNLYFDVFPHAKEQDDFERVSGYVTVRMQGMYLWLNTYRPLPVQASALFVPHQQAWFAFCHWSEVLCTQIHPLYGYGYDIDFEHDNYYTLDEKVEEALSNKQVPDLSGMLRGGGMRYVPNVHATDTFLVELLREPGISVRRLSDGGIFVIPQVMPFLYEHNEAFRQSVLGDQAQQEGVSGGVVVGHYQRSLGLFSLLEQEMPLTDPLTREIDSANNRIEANEVRRHLERFLEKDAKEDQAPKGFGDGFKEKE